MQYNNEIKAYPGNCHLLQSTKEKENTNIGGNDIEKKVKIVTENIKLKKLKQAFPGYEI